MTEHRSRKGKWLMTRSRFTVTFVPVPGVDDGIKALRAVLKNALRRHGLRCTDIREESAPAPDAANQVASALGQLRHDVRDRLRRRP